jgi:hypothetical protein
MQAGEAAVSIRIPGYENALQWFLALVILSD